MTGIRQPGRRFDLRMLGLCLAAMLATLTTMASSTMVNVAIPALMSQFGASAVGAQFVMTGFLATMTLAMPTAGAMTRRWGLRSVMLVALTVFALASLMAAGAGSLPVVETARLLQGAAAGVIQPAALAALYLAFPRESRGSAVGLHALATALAPAIGPWLGGLAVEGYGWRALFAGAVPVALVAAVACAAFVPRGDPPQPDAARFDVGGLTRISFAFACLMAGAWEFVRPAGNSSLAVCALIVGLVAAGVFVRHQLTVASPLVDLRLLKVSGFRAACAVGFLLAGGLYGSTLMVPLLAQFVQGQGPGASGLLLLPAGLVLLALSPVAGWMGNRYALAPLIAGGLFVFAMSNLAFLAVDARTAFVVTAAMLAVGRAGLAFANPLTNLAALRALPDRDAPQAAGLISFSRQLGSILAVIGFSAIVTPGVARKGAATDPEATIAAFHAAFALAAGLLLSGLLAVRWLARR